MTSALDRAAALGPYFAWERWAADGDWRPWASLADGDVAAERAGAARAALVGMFGLAEEAVPVRVVASVTLLGWAARVVSPLLGAAVVGGALPVVRPGDLWWRPGPGGPLPMAYGGSGTVPADGPDGTAEALAEVFAVLLTPLLETFRWRFGLSPKVLAGNVASALGGAAGMIAVAEPRLAERAAAVTERVLESAMLRGAGTLVRPDPQRARWFLVRRNCCLYYRIPGGGTCGECVLTPQAERARQWRAALAATR